MQPMLNVALRAACSAGELIFRSIEHLDIISVSEKGVKDYVTEVDRAAEQAITAALCKVYPTRAIMDKESGFVEGSGENTGYLWMINPLDGTTNFIHGVLHFVVSIACEYKDHLEHAIVLDPVRRGEFTVSRGRGTALNGRCLCVSGRRSLEGVLFGTGFPFRDSQVDNLDNYLSMFHSLVGRIVDIRRAGAASLNLIHVAAGCYGAFQEFGPPGWDMAASALLVQEADDLASDFTDSHEFLEKGHIVAGDTKCFKTLLTTVQPHLPPSLKR